MIGGAQFGVIASKMRGGARMPDCRDGMLGVTCDDAFEEIVAEIEDLVDSMKPQLICNDGGPYLLRMVSAAR